MEKDVRHIEVTTIERLITCKYCGSTNLNKYGKYNDTQYYFCKDCNRNISGNDTYPRMKYLKDLNIMALTYYYNGMSYKNINHTFNDLLGYNLPKSTIWRWLIKYSKM